MPVANRTIARDAIILLFETAWAAMTPPVPVLLFEDVESDIPSSDPPSPWARIQVHHVTSNQATLSNDVGSRRFRRFGLVAVRIYTRPGDGLSESDRLVKVAIDAFEGITAPGGIIFRNVRAPEEGQEGVWYQTDVLADFEYDTVK